MMDADKARAGLTGGCQCGAVRYRVDQAPEYASLCHCRMCQKAGGAPFMAFFAVRRKNLVFTHGALATFRSSAIAQRGFCSACGTPLSYRMDGRDHVSVTIGSLDDPADVPPTEQLGVESMLPWFPHLADLPKSESKAWMRKYKITDAGSRQHPDRET
jgi:hypothetical protein